MFFVFPGRCQRQRLYATPSLVPIYPPSLQCSQPWLHIGGVSCRAPAPRLGRWKGTAGWKVTEPPCLFVRLQRCRKHLCHLSCAWNRSRTWLGPSSQNLLEGKPMAPIISSFMMEVRVAPTHQTVMECTTCMSSFSANVPLALLTNKHPVAPCNMVHGRHMCAKEI